MKPADFSGRNGQRDPFSFDPQDLFLPLLGKKFTAEAIGYVSVYFQDYDHSLMEGRPCLRTGSYQLIDWNH